MKEFRYKSIFMQGSLQFCGNIVEYFVENTEKLVVFYVMPRTGNEQNLIRLYNKGKLVEEKVVKSSKNLILCYICIYYNFVKILFSYFSRNEKFFVLAAHPLFLYFRSFLNLFRSYECVYSVDDYYPGYNPINVMYRIIAKYYHDRSRFRTYISDRLNKKMNGRIMQNKYIKTVMWGIKPPKTYKKQANRPITLCFIGAIRESHGIKLALDLLLKQKGLKIKILGTCPSHLFKKYQKLIKAYGISDRVYFPNKFTENLEQEVKDCHMGIALYDIRSGSYYSDPGKVKTYAQLGLPIVMTDVAEVAGYLIKFKAGVVVDERVESVWKGIQRIYKSYLVYMQGLERFNQYFTYTTYYARVFRFLEHE